MAYLAIHTHQIWPTLISDLTEQLSSDIDKCFCLIRILKYMANDCDNDSIVVEESVKHSFFDYLDSNALENVFKAIFETWVTQIKA